MKKLFGTDGVRGRANQEPMTPETALALGQALAYHFKREKGTNRIIIGKDTRRSCYMLEEAITAGVCSMGSYAILTGPLPTPGVAFLTRTMRADAGIMISASHNEFHDNGIKFFDQDGFKLSDEVELELEDFVFHKTRAIERPTGSDIGKARRIDDVRGRYTEYVKTTFPINLSLEGLKIVVDCANGAAYQIAPWVLWELGAEVISIGVTPDGTNINKDCGAVSPQVLCEKVIAEKADVGLALDGDADRVILCDEKGKLIDGDQVIAICALQLLREGKLNPKEVVGTVMTNMGIENFFSEKGLGLVRTQVGDRYIIEAMRQRKIVLGGEPSGHVIFSEHSTTGDGLIAGLQVLAALRRSGLQLSGLAKNFPLYPQVSRSFPVRCRVPLDQISPVSKAIKELENRLQKKGRAIIRYSGTEPVLRLMIEGNDSSMIQKELNTLSAIIEKNLN